MVVSAGVGVATPDATLGSQCRWYVAVVGYRRVGFAENTAEVNGGQVGRRVVGGRGWMDGWHCCWVKAVRRQS